MTVRNTWPQELVPASGIDHTVERVAMRTELGTGATLSRSYQSRSKRGYKFRPALLEADTTYAAKVRRLVILVERHLVGGLTPVYWRETASYVHENVYCGVGDASKTTFVVPVIKDSSTPYSIVPAIDGVRQESGWSERAAVNLLTDSQATMGAGGYTNVVGTEAIGDAWDQTADGITCFEVAPPAGTADCGVTQTLATMPAATAGRVYTGMASGRFATYTLRVDIQWYQSDRSTLISTTSGTPVAMSGSGWTQVTTTGTAPANTAYARVVVVRPDVSTTRFLIDCIGLAPGDLTDWYLPSVAPMALEFAAAPTAGQVITACEAHGYRLVRCRLKDDGVGWRLTAPGHVQVPTVHLVEDWATTG